MRTTSGVPPSTFRHTARPNSRGSREAPGQVGEEAREVADIELPGGPYWGAPHSALGSSAIQREGTLSGLG
eukprot:12863957-Alexandrium_andersonii.AAC.1